MTVSTVPNTCLYSRLHAVSHFLCVADITSSSFPIVIQMLITMATVETFKFPGVPISRSVLIPRDSDANIFGRREPVGRGCDPAGFTSRLKA